MIMKKFSILLLSSFSSYFVSQFINSHIAPVCKRALLLSASFLTLNFIMNRFIICFASQLAGGRADDGENEDEDDEDDVDEADDQVMPLGE